MMRRKQAIELLRKIVYYVYMDQHQHHEDLIFRIAKEYKDILNGSNQGIYIYLDDTHKVCNKKFSDLLNYSSPDEWAKITTPFPDTFVKEDSQSDLVSAYANAMQEEDASTNKITWKTKDGNYIDTEVILVPITFEGHLLALHFII